MAVRYRDDEVDYLLDNPRALCPRDECGGTVQRPRPKASLGKATMERKVLCTKCGAEGERTESAPPIRNRGQEPTGGNRGRRT